MSNLRVPFALPFCDLSHSIARHSRWANHFSRMKVAGVFQSSLHNQYVDWRVEMNACAELIQWNMGCQTFPAIEIVILFLLHFLLNKTYWSNMRFAHKTSQLRRRVGNPLRVHRMISLQLHRMCHWITFRMRNQPDSLKWRKGIREKLLIPLENITSSWTHIFFARRRDLF